MTNLPFKSIFAKRIVRIAHVTKCQSPAVGTPFAHRAMSFGWTHVILNRYVHPEQVHVILSEAKDLKK